MKNRCQLCGGRIAKGKCTDCGMDYTRRKEEYRLNEPRRSQREESSDGKPAEFRPEIEKLLEKKAQAAGKTFTELKKQYAASRKAVVQARKTQKLGWVVMILILIMVIICMALGYTQGI